MGRAALIDISEGREAPPQLAVFLHDFDLRAISASGGCIHRPIKNWFSGEGSYRDVNSRLHLKHFDAPLTIFAQDELLGTSSADLATKKLSDPNAAPFLTSLFSWSFAPQELASSEEGWPVDDASGLLASVAEARASFFSHLYQLKLASGMMREVQRVMLDLGYRGAETDKTPLEMMSASMMGGLGREGKYLGGMTEKLPGEKLQTLLRELRSFLDELPDHLDDV
ncbi:hypothetical protein BJV78DRAFT_1158138 [Lactifluus subvellereus]|nr:hypothetical protein BJV78DRAFT_1158138 [Lactifluus subvellereus]